MTTEAPVPGTSAYLIDAGPLVASLYADEQHHAWAVRTLDRLDAPLLTCEAVLSEAWFLTQRGGGNPARVLDLLRVLEAEVVPAWNERTDALLRQYAQRTSLADASLLVLAEADARRVVVTLDRRDFGVYRIHRRRAVPTLVPPG